MLRAPLSWWPLHLPASEQVEMEMVHLLPTVGAGVDDASVSARQSLLTRNPPGDDEQLSEHRLVLRANLEEAGDGLLRNYENVNGGLRVDVSEGHAQIVLVNDVGVDLSLYDSGKNGLICHSSPLSK